MNRQERQERQDRQGKKKISISSLLAVLAVLAFLAVENRFHSCRFVRFVGKHVRSRRVGDFVGQEAGDSGRSGSIGVT